MAESIFLRCIRIRNIVKKKQNATKKHSQLVESFLPSPSWVCFPLVLAVCLGDVYCQCLDRRQASAGVLAGAVNFEAPGNSVPEELCRHCAMAGWLAGRQLNGWGECVG